MRKLLGLSLAIALGAAAVALADTGKVYGKGVTLEKPVAIADLLAHPETYVGKPVRVDGVITGVCKMRGCWVQVNDPATGTGIRVKVEDGVIVFPPETMGHKASAQGVFEVVVPAGEHREHAAAGADAGHGEEGHTCAAEQAEAKAKPAATYRIAGTGAIVY